jgi:hypothetical protein
MHLRMKFVLAGGRKSVYVTPLRLRWFHGQAMEVL